ncbi:uncharacterized protein LOC110689155 [Chenopodium quinoa]|uniref:S-adenosyl-L-methionine-dependent methyltransferase superfamily protein n=1 Tax=Chenopodium quinoa TaxID=63459 RepID=A0A803LLW0_CHEQI|nr:uncharacterized protein LOC110689155 [Chenopodium quinoa]
MWQWRISKLSTNSKVRRLSTSLKSKFEDEGSWSYSTQWWGSDSDHHSHSVFRATSSHGNGVVSVLAYPSSLPAANRWPKTEEWLRKRYAEVCSDAKHDECFKVLGYQWRVLRFNDVTRQSAVKVMAAIKMSDSSSVYYMQQPHVLAVPYTKSMVAAGFTALSSTKYDLVNAVNGKKQMRVLCVGHGGGSLPLFIASKIQGAVIDIVEIDPLVISTSIHAMGFPSFSVAVPSGCHALSKPNTMDEVLWKGVHERLFLYESDVEKFILNTENVYDIIFIDAYDGNDIFPRKLWDPDSPFLLALGSKLNPCHGTVVVNLHSDDDVSADAPVAALHQLVLPMRKYVSRVCQAYKDMLVGKESSSSNKQLPGVGFTISVPWVCNTTLVLCRGFGVDAGSLDQDSVLSSLMSKSLEVDKDLNMPFSCLQYINRSFRLRG